MSKRTPSIAFQAHWPSTEVCWEVGTFAAWHDLAFLDESGGVVKHLGRGKQSEVVCGSFMSDIADLHSSPQNQGNSPIRLLRRNN